MRIVDDGSECFPGLGQAIRDFFNGLFVDKSSTGSQLEPTRTIAPLPTNTSIPAVGTPNLPATSTPRPTSTPDPEGEWEWVGMHGTSTENMSSILTGIDPTLGAGQLGPGFYTTPQLPYAELNAFRAVDKFGGKAVILGVQAKGFTTGENPMKGLYVPVGATITPAMLANYDYLYGPVESFPGMFQVKFNARAAPRIRAVPMPAILPEFARPKDKRYDWKEIG
jgi:hypothetical protein